MNLPLNPDNIDVYVCRNCMRLFWSRLKRGSIDHACPRCGKLQGTYIMLLGPLIEGVMYAFHERSEC